jgi:transposase-like protein
VIDSYRMEIEAALAAGASKASVARALGVPPTTVHSAVERWQRPEREQPGNKALEELKRLVDGR